MASAATFPAEAPVASALPSASANAVRASTATGTFANGGASPRDADAVAAVVDAARIAAAPSTAIQFVAFGTPRARAAALTDLAVLADAAAPESKATAALVEMASALRERGLADAIDAFRRHDEAEQHAATDSLAASAMVSTGFSVGYVLWLARGGALAASLLSALPAWAMVDPLPVLSRMRTAAERDGDADDDKTFDDDTRPTDDADDDAVESLFTRARRFAREATARAPVAPERAPPDRSAAPAGTTSGTTP